MIRADTRSRLTAQDLDLLSLCLGGSRSEGDRELIRQGLDAVLDRPEVVAYLFRASLPGPSASLLFYVLTRHALLERGIDDVPVSCTNGCVVGAGSTRTSSGRKARSSSGLVSCTKKGCPGRQGQLSPVTRSGP